ncbi:MAG: alpha/beta hydrolase [Spirochaetes bacterium]|nr:MAG: alpha/beta hydrolase [Spirochaetota bacterium]
MITELRFKASASSGEVGAIMMRPPDARKLLVLAHGAGAGMRSPFMEETARELAAIQVATFRYQFPYMENGRKPPDPRPILTATVLAAIEAARAAAPDLPLFAGGKSLGGRMSSLAALPPQVRGLVFFGFPLHAPGKSSNERAGHLAGVRVPMLFLQGTRDSFAGLALLRPVCEGLGERATLFTIEGADHSFHVPRSSGTSDGEVLKKLARETADWMEGVG